MRKDFEKSAVGLLTLNFTCAKSHLTHGLNNLLLNKKFTDQVEFESIFKDLFFANLTKILNGLTNVTYQ